MVSHQHGGGDEEAIVVAERERVGKLVRPVDVHHLTRILQNTGDPASNALRLTIRASIDDQDLCTCDPLPNEQ